MDESEIKRLTALVDQGIKLDSGDRAMLVDQVKHVLLRRAAYHEAGHAVIARTMGQLAGPATIVPDGDSGGNAIIADPWDTIAAWDIAGRWRERRSILIGRIIAAMAGTEAERAFSNFTILGSDETDLLQIEMMIAEAFPDASAETQKRMDVKLRRWARYFVRRHIHSIKLVSEALLDRKTLSSEEIDSIAGIRSI